MTLLNILLYLSLGTALIFFVPGARNKGLVALVLIAIGAIYSAIAGTEAILTGTASTLLEGADPLSGVFLWAIAVGGISCAVYGVGYVTHYAGQKSQMQVAIHFASLVVLFYSMIGVVTATEAYSFLFRWELMTLSSFLLVMFEGERKEVLHAAGGYLILMHIGFFLLLGGFISEGESFFGFHATENAGLNTSLGGVALSIPTFLLLLGGFGLKAGLFPLHIWLPVTHPAAPSHVSALMSGVMIKMGIYGILRALMALTPEALYSMGLLVFVVGAVTAIFGIMKAAVQTDLKRLLAYSSIENIGVICLGLGFGSIGRSMGSDLLTYVGFGGAIIHTLGHSHYKSLLFLSAGSVIAATHHRDMNLLGGLLRRMPLTGALFLVGTLAICAVPPLVGFTSEFVLLSGWFKAIATHQAIVISVAGIVTLVMVGGLTLMTFTKAFGITFLGNPRGTAARDAREVNRWMLLAQVLPLAGVIVGPWLYAHLILGHANTLFGTPYPAQPMINTLQTIQQVGGITVGLIAFLLLFKWAANRLARQRSVRRPTWGCAFTAPNKEMQYSASSYNRELETVWADRGADHQTKDFGEEEFFPKTHEFHTEAPKDTAASTITRYFSHWVRRWTARLALFQTGKTNHYILHALLLLTAILILSLCGVL